MTKPRIVYLDRTTPPHISTLVLVAGLAALTLNIFLPSLADMARHFGTPYAVMQLAVSAYLAGTAVLQLAIGPLSDLFGRRPVMLTCIGLLALGSVICLLAPNVTVFMIGRILQTAIVAGFVLSRAIVRDMVPADQAASMIGYVTMGMSLVPMVAPALGGVLNDAYGWQANFVVMLVYALICLVVVYRDLGETHHHRSKSVADQFRAWPELVRAPAFWGFALTCGFASGIFYAFLGGAPFIGTVIYRLTPAMLGLQFMLLALGYTLGNFISGRYASRIGIIRMIMSGNLISLAGVILALLLLLLGFDSAFAFFGPLSLVGLGNGLTLPSANAGLVSVKPHLAGSASGLGGALYVGGGAACSVLAGWLVTEETGALPVLCLMLASSLLALIFSEMIRRTQERLSLDDDT
ncbi:multidrug effflux MFS transporter [Rhizobium sp. SSA_523]|uniref:multidrug effflux MFS transporter n=1 Tax=Rhizobium sp. SSA_523 TaxID=2952477 RepID=UPI0020919A1B|nr:multidrug effflux MFS transporter [Rhizobium sp. SSA_523]MCO5730026.1 multidrug effflux MFS transporter [Rhizobium sp. SSA_523]WKC25096.1 multidrug effflux MFS transporter [Rhizobium sp. SSA_523]